MKYSSHNYGIDILRIISIVGVIVLHVLGHGGILASVESPTSFSMAMAFETLAFPAVNCFVLISGYVGYRDDKLYPKLKNIINLFFVVVFYSVLITLLFITTFSSKRDLLASFFPISSDKYWFFTAYFGMFLLSPILNRFVYSSDAKQLFLFTAVFAFFSLCLTFSQLMFLSRKSFSFADGYSVIWFLFIYLIGAIIKKYNLPDFFSKKTWGLLILLSFLLTWSTKVIFTFVNIPALQLRSSLFLSYISPTVILMAIGWLCLMVKSSCSEKLIPVLNFLSSSAFSVYLIHEHPLIRSNLISKIHCYANENNALTLAVYVFTCVTVIFLSCTLLDKIREMLFRLLNINGLSVKIEQSIKSAMHRLYNTLKSHFRHIAK